MARMLRLLGIPAFVMAIGVGCSSAREHGEAQQTEASATRAESANEPAARVSAPFDIGAIVQRVHFAFRANGDAFEASHATFGVRARARDVAFRPVRAEKGAAPLTLATAAIDRDGDSLLHAGAAPHVESDGHLVIERGGAVEHLRNAEEGTEQSWTFSARPRGRGDLVVRVRASGEEYAGETARGHHFVDKSSGLGVRYGVATWVDARGARTPVRTTYDAGALVMRVPENALDGATYPASLDPVIGPEFGLDNPLIAPAPGNQTAPSVAWNGQTFLVAWSDSRAGTPANYAARVQPDGTLLDTSGIALPPAGNAPTSVGVASAGISAGGTSWLVACGSSSGVSGALVTSTGSAGAAIPLATGVNVSNGLALTTDGSSNFYVVWSTAASAVQAELVSYAGSIVPGTQRTIGTGFGPSAAFAPSGNGGEYLVAYDNGSQIYGNRVASSGAPIDPQNAPLLIGNTGATSFATSMASDGTSFLVAWTDNTNGCTSTRTEAQLVRADGTLGSSAVVPMTISSQNNCFFALGKPAVGFGGGSYIVAYNFVVSASDYRIYGKHVSTAGAADTQPTLLADAQFVQTAPTMAFDEAAGEIFLAWQDSRTDGASYDIYGGVFDPASLAQSGNDVIVSTTANAEQHLSLAWSPGASSWLAVWEDSRPGSTTDVWGMRINGAGTLLDPSGFAVSQRPGSQFRPRVASNGNDFFVVWSDQSSGTPVYGTPVLANGTVASPAGLKLCQTSSTQVSPAIASNGSDYIVAWQDDRNLATSGYDIYGLHVDGAGNVPAAQANGVALVTAAGTQSTPALAWAASSSQYLLTWADRRNGATFAVFGHAYSGSGSAIGAESPISLANAVGEAPAVASDATNWLVTWDDTANVLGAIVAPGGGVTQRVTIANGPAREFGSTAAYDGANYWCAWQDARSGGSDLYGARVDASGALLDPAGILISNDANDEVNPTIAAGSFRQLLVGYDVLQSSLGAQRAHVRLIDNHLAVGEACQVNQDCANGACIDGYCCSASPCTGCMACSAAKTGQANGQCVTVINGTDPNGTCGASPFACAPNRCQSGSCAPTAQPGSCFVGNACYPSGATNPGNACQTCQPGASTTQFTNADGIGCASDGIACTDDVCAAGACTHPVTANSCYIGGACYAAGAPNPTNACQTCQPGVSATQFSNADGTACAADLFACTSDVCAAGVCAHPLQSGSCLIDGACQATGALNPSDACQWCAPATSVSAWSPNPSCVSDGGGDAGTIGTDASANDGSTGDGGTIDNDAAANDGGTIDNDASATDGGDASALDGATDGAILGDGSADDGAASDGSIGGDASSDAGDASAEGEGGLGDGGISDGGTDADASNVGADAGANEAGETTDGGGVLEGDAAGDGGSEAGISADNGADSGCGCRVAGTSHTSAGWGALGTMALAAIRLRRRTKASPEPGARGPM